MIKVFDFFSGCGGTSCGFQQAGMEIVMGLDIDPDAALTYRTNFPRAKFIETDIRNLSADALAPMLLDRSQPILFCGCAPCQPFSKQNLQKDVNDPRRSLLTEFGRFVESGLPDYIFIENVPGLQRVKGDDGPLHGFKSLLTRLGYSYKIDVLPALWFGVPQTRERLVLLAGRFSEITFPAPTHGPGKLPFSTVFDWIGSLPSLEAGKTHHDDDDHQAAALTEINLNRISRTPEGKGRESWPKELWLECHRNHKGHTDVYGRLAWNKPAAGLTTRCISYSNGRFGHPDQNRAITIREAACLQTFPRYYAFKGKLNSKARQIGNAVPPLMAQRFGEAILSHWNKQRGLPPKLKGSASQLFCDR